MVTDLTIGVASSSVTFGWGLTVHSLVQQLLEQLYLHSLAQQLRICREAVRHSRVPALLILKYYETDFLRFSQIFVFLFLAFLLESDYTTLFE